MIVVAIIGVLAAIALPAYHSYTIRAKLLETIQFSGVAKTYLWEEYFTLGQMPDTSSHAADMVKNMMATSKYISNTSYTKIDKNHAVLEVSFQNLGLDTDNSTLLFRYETDGEQITLDCRDGTLPNTYRPASCRNNN